MLYCPQLSKNSRTVDYCVSPSGSEKCFEAGGGTSGTEEYFDFFKLRSICCG